MTPKNTLFSLINLIFFQLHLVACLRHGYVKISLQGQGHYAVDTGGEGHTSEGEEGGEDQGEHGGLVRGGEGGKAEGEGHTYLGQEKIFC